MKHFVRKNLLRGAGIFGGKKPKPQPAVLRPPNLGQYEIASSYEIAEVIDLIGDGPIDGLVNQNNKLVEDKNILQGIYLDNTPIEVTNNNILSNNISYSLYKSSQQTDGKSYFSSLVRNIALNSFTESFQPIAKYPNGWLTPVFSPFCYITEYTADWSRALQFGFHQGSNVTTLAVPYNAGFRPLTLNNSANSSQADIGSWYYYSDRVKLNQWTKSAWYITNLNYNGSDTSSTIYAKDQVTANTRWEMHYYNISATQTTLTANKSIFTEFKTRLNNEINNSANSDEYKNYLGQLKTLATNFESTPFGYENQFSPSPSESMVLILKVGTYGSTTSSTTQGVVFENGDNPNKTILNSTKPYKIVVENMDLFPQDNIINLLIPKVNGGSSSTTKNILTGEFYGLIILKIPLTYKFIDLTPSKSFRYYTWSFPNSVRDFTKTNLNLYIQEDDQVVKQNSVRKFNFGNTLCEFRNGEEQQKPLNNFNNIYIDYEYNRDLLGPFRTTGEVRRIVETQQAILATNAYVVTLNSNLRVGGNPTLNENDSSKEGSLDQSRLAGTNVPFASWNKAYDYNENAIPITHTIENPNVQRVCFTLSIDNLRDTLSKDIIEPTLKAGDAYPGILVVSVEWGKVKNGQFSEIKTKEFTIICQVQGRMTIDFGSPNLPAKTANPLYQWIVPVNDAFSPFELPVLDKNEDPTITKRYIKITKVSTETNSVLLKRDASLAKVTEIITNNLSYPFSSIVGVKLDARTFSSLPERSYDCRLKKIKVPSNYFPIDSLNQTDKRYISSASTYNNTNQVYVGDWDGSFSIRWTDNPAWILYDLLTNERYGLGSYIDASQINIWELYKIGRFCDAVDDNGYFIGVSDGVGGLEPRYSCNILFKENTKLFDAINVIANLFRGVVFFSNSEIHFLDDRPRVPIAIFSNTNVKNGEFNYTNYRKDQQYNTVEVSYLDRFDNYQTKVEFVEDEVDVRKRGISKTIVNTQGVTSRAMARRIGQHIIYQTLKENQGVEFIAGLESLLCRPGDLVIIEDELKTRSTNYGRILGVNNSAKTMLIENEYDATNFTGKLTVYTPTGYTTYSESEEIARTNRSRMQQFSITGTSSVITSSLTGNYYFSGYVAGYPTNYAGLSDFNYPTQFANYTGKHTLGHDLYAYYNTGVTGWVFATGRAFSNNTTYDKAITNTGISSLSEVFYAPSDSYKSTGYNYITSSNKRGATSSYIANLFSGLEETKGILDSEINLTNISQITTFNITGYSGGGDNYAYTLYLDTGDPNINLLPFVAQGSPYRIQRKNAADQIYKVVSIREENQNEYRVVASKYDTGKFAVIEDFSSDDYLPDTYYTGPVSVNSLNVSELSAPIINGFGTGTTSPTSFQLTGSWSAVSSATGYQTILTNSITQFSTGTIHSSATTQYTWSDLNDIGRWDLQIKALGNRSTTWDSKYAKANTFVVYQTITTYNRASVLNFKILK